jgi:hypothetical protein
MSSSLDKLLSRVQDPKVEQVLRITQKNRKYPLDCVTDGALEIVVKYIVELEERCGGKETGARAARS